jgi:hypothetical protein
MRAGSKLLLQSNEMLYFVKKLILKTGVNANEITEPGFVRY